MRREVVVNEERRWVKKKLGVEVVGRRIEEVGVDEMRKRGGWE